MTRINIRLLTVLITLIWILPAQADKVFIRDTLYVPVRGGQSSEHRIIHQGLRSGTEVERLDSNEDTGFSRIRTERGLEGWIQSQYLVTEPIAEDLLQEYRDKLRTIEKEYELAQSDLQEQMDLNGTSADRIARLEESNNSLDDELTRITELASNVISIDEQNEQLEQEREQLMQQLDDLAGRMNELKDTSDREWFLLGAVTILLGLLFGFAAGRKLYYKTNSGWN